jgi:hypothetical protein
MVQLQESLRNEVEIMRNKVMLILAIVFLVFAIIFFIEGNNSVSMELLIVSLIINFARSIIEILEKRKQ